MVAALERLAAEHGSALQTPNLDVGAEVDGISVHLDRFGIGTDWIRAHIPVLYVTVFNRGSNNLSVAGDQQVGELEVDGVWYSWPNPTNVSDAASAAAGNRSAQFQPIVGTQWHAKARGIGQTAGMGAPLNLVRGIHTIRFAVIAHRIASVIRSGLAPEVRAVSNPVEIQVWEDAFLSRRPPKSGGAANSS